MVIYTVIVAWITHIRILLHGLLCRSELIKVTLQKEKRLEF